MIARKLGQIAKTALRCAGERHPAARWIAEFVAGPIDIDHLIAHLPHRLLAERRETRSLDKPQLDRLAMELEISDGPQFTALFDLWKRDGEVAVRTELVAEKRLT